MMYIGYAYSPRESDVLQEWRYIPEVHYKFPCDLYVGCMEEEGFEKEIPLSSGCEDLYNAPKKHKPSD